MKEYIKEACMCAKNGASNNEGGPFGAVIVDKEGNIVSKGNNRVIIDNDPTAHAEVVAIRKACHDINSYNLEGYTLYSSCEPCPMCLSAIIWSNIKTVYYGSTREDAYKIGFRDEVIYNYLEGKSKDLIDVKQLKVEACDEIMEEYKENNKTIY